MMGGSAEKTSRMCYCSDELPAELENEQASMTSRVAWLSSQEVGVCTKCGEPDTSEWYDDNKASKTDNASTKQDMDFL